MYINKNTLHSTSYKYAVTARQSNNAKLAGVGAVWIVFLSYLFLGDPSAFEGALGFASHVSVGIYAYGIFLILLWMNLFSISNVMKSVPI